MFNHLGPSRSPRQNRLLAGSLALVAGYANAAGLLLVNNFTSHMTGNSARIAVNLAARDYGAATGALGLVLFFFLGAFVSSSLLHANPRRSSTPYALALGLEALLLLAFVLVEARPHRSTPRLMDAEAALLCLAMGMQNTLITNISGVRVRTTHMTGVVTDLAIEAARWLRWHRWRLLHDTGWPLVAGEPAEPPERSTLLFHLTLFTGFLVGGVLGAALAATFRGQALLAPAAGSLAAAGYALHVGRKGRVSAEQPALVDSPKVP